MSLYKRTISLFKLEGFSCTSWLHFYIGNKLFTTSKLYTVLKTLSSQIGQLGIIILIKIIYNAKSSYLLDSPEELTLYS